MCEKDPGHLFDVYDIKHAGALPKHEVHHVLRSCFPTRLFAAGQLDELLAAYPEPMSKEDVLKAVAAAQPSIEANTLGHSLAAFDARETGGLTDVDIRNIFLSMKDKLTPEMLAAVLTGYKTKTSSNRGGSEVSYDLASFEKWLMQRPEEITVTREDIENVLK